MTVANAIRGRATDGRMRNGRFAPETMTRPHAADEDNPHEERLATGLGWFSIGLGLSQVLAPRGVARFIGVQDDVKNCALLRMIGLRELACGVGILTKRRPAGWVWARVAGDMMDIALLGSAMAGGAPRRDKVSAATAAVLGVTALDLYDAVQLSSGTEGGTGGIGLREIRVRKAITVNRPAGEVYRFWRDFRNLPRFMHHVESVQVADDRRSHWKVKAPAGMSVEWDAEIVEDQPDDRIAWRSVPGSQVDNAGSVRFVPAAGNRGTEVHVELRYSPPGGVVGAAIAWLFGESPDQQVYDDLRALKQVMETGEIVVSEGTLGQRGYRQRPAQPPAQLPAGWSRR
jgi:uncharacterized membrane protein